MNDPKLAKKLAAQESLYSFRKEHGEADLSLVRDRLLAIINADPGVYAVKEVIWAAKELGRMHGAYGQEKPMVRGEAEPKENIQEIKLTPEQEARLSALLGGVK